MNQIYGKFAVVEQLHQNPNGAVFSAHSVRGRENPSACIKVVQLTESMLQERDTSSAQALLVSAALQQTMANKSEFWAPVYELDSNGTNAYYVSRLYPRSLKSIIESQTTLNSSELQLVLLSIIDGLIDLDTAYHRPHGNLKPSNVLVADRARFQHGGVMLADPDPLADSTPSLDRAPDTKAIGQILYALVTHKPHTGARLPLQKNRAWKDLGPSGKKWFAICSRLLNTFSEQGLPVLESIRTQIANIRPSRRRMPRGVWAALVLLIAGGAAYAFRTPLESAYAVSRDYVMAQIGPYLNTSKSGTKYGYLKRQNEIGGSGRAGTTLPTTAATQPAVKPEHQTQKTQTEVANQLPPPPPPPAPPDQSFVTDAPIPEFHSQEVQNQYVRDRDQLLADRKAAGSPVSAVEWRKTYSDLVALDSLFPAPQPGDWSADLVKAIQSRRNNELSLAVDAVFKRGKADPLPYTTETTAAQRAVDASIAAKNALAAADLTAAEKAVTDFLNKADALSEIDPKAADAFNPTRTQAQAFIDAGSSADPTRLKMDAASSTELLSIRIRSWLRLRKAQTTAWPADLAVLVYDRGQGQKLAELAKDTPVTVSLINSEQTDRLNAFFGSLHDEASVLAAVHQANDTNAVPLAGLYPDWFNFDIQLANAKAAVADQESTITGSAAQQFLELADKVQSPDAKPLKAAFTAIAQPRRTLDNTGPAAAAGWRTDPLSNLAHRVYQSGDETLEFLHVTRPSSRDHAAVDCYLSTTETPVSLLALVLGKNSGRVKVAADLNTHILSGGAAMAIWNLSDSGVTLDIDDYKACFIRKPTPQLPLQFVTPQMSLYTARLLGCRLPTADEWRAALDQATAPAASPQLQGYAARGWKLRDQDFTSAMVRANRSTTPYWPNGHIFRDPTLPRVGGPQSDRQIWSPDALDKLLSSIAPGGVANAADPAIEASQMGFRSVNDGSPATGVFHDLIGNVGEFVLEGPIVASEKLDVSNPDQAADAVRGFFSSNPGPEISVIGGSALSPPDLDPLKPCPLPADAPTRAFSDVGFRLAFTNPAASVGVDPIAQQQAAIKQAVFMLANNKTTEAHE